MFVDGFRPLSWGLFFNQPGTVITVNVERVFVPFLGDFFSISWLFMKRHILRVFVPFLGDFFSMRQCWRQSKPASFRPLSWGLFFNMISSRSFGWKTSGFRPLSWGLFFNTIHGYFHRRQGVFSSPFLGTFFQFSHRRLLLRLPCSRFSSPFLGTFFQLDGAKQFETASGNVFSSPFLGTFFQ